LTSPDNKLLLGLCGLSNMVIADELKWPVACYICCCCAAVFVMDLFAKFAKFVLCSVAV